MKNLFFCAASLCLALINARGAVNVTQEHNNLSRDGVYVDAAFTPAAAANLTRDTNFNGVIVGNVLAQPLYIEGGPNGPMVIAVTESNNVYALNAITGNIIWQRNVGAAVPTSQLPCGTINPLGNQRHAGCRSCLSRSLFRCDDDARWRHDQTASHFLAQCGHRRDQRWLAGKCDQRVARLQCRPPQQPRRGGGGERHRVYHLLWAQRGLHALTTAGWLACKSTIPRPLWAGRRRLSVAESGDTPAWPATARTCM